MEVGYLKAFVRDEAIYLDMETDENVERATTILMRDPSVVAHVPTSLPEDTDPHAITRWEHEVSDKIIDQVHTALIKVKTDYNDKEIKAMKAFRVAWNDGISDAENFPKIVYAHSFENFETIMSEVHECDKSHECSPNNFLFQDQPDTQELATLLSHDAAEFEKVREYIRETWADGYVCFREVGVAVYLNDTLMATGMDEDEAMREAEEEAEKAGLQNDEDHDWHDEITIRSL